MGTIQSQKIGLRIAGTKFRQGGFTPLVAVGILAGDAGNNMDKITVIAEKPVYVIKHTNDYILYQLIDRKVKPCDRDTVGILSIALTVTRDVQLANDKSPYSLLKEVYDKFVSEYMKRSSDGLDSFLNKNIDQDIFVSILEQYPLEPRPSSYIPMNPTGMSGILCVPHDKMVELFRDSQYKEFSSFKEIEIGANCMTMPGLENIEIPRPKIYSVIVNGTETGITMKKTTDSFNTTNILHDTQDITYDNITFSLAELQEAPNHKIDKGKSSIELDDAHNRIVCNINKKQLTYTIKYSIEGGTDENKASVVYLIVENRIRLTIGGTVVRFTSNSPKETTIPASYANQEVNITPNQINALEFNIKSSIDNTKRNINVTIKLKPLTIGDTFTAQSNKKPSGNKSRSVTGESEPKDYNPLINSDSNIAGNVYNANAKKKENYIRLIFLLVGIGIGVCVGIGFGTKKVIQPNNKKSTDIHIDTLTLKDSIKIYNIIKTKIEQPKPFTGNNEAAKDSENLKSSESPQAPNSTEEINNNNTEEEKKQKKERARNEILQLVNAKNLKACRNHEGWKRNGYLTEDEKSAVEAVLDLNKYKHKSPQSKKRIKDLNDGTFKSFEEIRDAQKQIWKILKEEQ